MKKKFRPPAFFRWLGAIIVVFCLWLVLSPASRVPHKQTAVHAHVEQPASIVLPEIPETPSVGDEKAEASPKEVTVPVKPEYVEPKVNGKKPVVAIIIDDVGLDMRGSKQAIDLPAYITLSFMPYATRLREQTKDARDRGHELMLHMPMEPVGHDDPGPGALFVDFSPDEIRARLQTALASFVGFDGVNNHMGSKFTSDSTGMEIVVDELQQRHLFFLDSRTSPKSVGETIAERHGLPTASRDVFLDDEENLNAINAQLMQTEKLARRKGYAIAIGHPHAVTMQALQSWLPGAEARGIKFVPVREVIKSPVQP